MKNGKLQLQLMIASVLASGYEFYNEVTVENTDYSAEAIKEIYLVLGTGNEVFEKGSTQLITGIPSKQALGIMKSADDPLGAYEVTPSGETADTDYSERSLEMVASMLYETITPSQWHAIWKIARASGNTFTNLAMNPLVMRKAMQLYKNKTGAQISKWFWQGVKANGGGQPDGIITRAAADAAVIDVTPAGAITQANAIAIFSSVWQSIPDQFFENPDYVIHCNTTDYKLLQLANQAAAAGTDGYLNNVVRDMLLNHKIKHYAGLPKDRIVGALGRNDETSNLVMGVYATPDQEMGAPRIDRVSNNSDAHFIRVNYKMDVNYREGSEIVLYQPA